MAASSCPKRLWPGWLLRKWLLCFLSLPCPTACEWQGIAQHLDVAVGTQSLADAVGRYPDPVPASLSLKGWMAFYAGRVDRCLVDARDVTPQPGDLYARCVTPDIVRPFKGRPGTWRW